MTCTKAAGKKKGKAMKAELLRFFLLCALLAGLARPLSAQAQPAGFGGVGLKVKPGSLPLPRLSPLSVRVFPPFSNSLPGRKTELRAMPEISADYSYQNLGIFCKWEVQLEKKARIPVRFRLGEVQYVDRLEGKSPTY